MRIAWWVAVTTCLSPAFAMAETLPRSFVSTPTQRLHSLLGLVVLIALVWLVGRLRGAKQVPWRVILWGTALQFVFGAMVLRIPAVLTGIQATIQRLLDFSNDGARLIFGNLIANPVLVTADADGRTAVTGFAQIGYAFAFNVLPTIIFVALLTAVLYHLGVLTLVVNAFAWVMQKTMGTSGAETLSTAANIFVGQTEAPLLVKPFLAAATRSEMMVIMIGGFANIASGVLAAYTGMLKNYIPDVGGHLAAACFISAPATLVVAKLLLPETERPATLKTEDVRVTRVDANLIDAATRGTTEGTALAINVGAMLIAFTALIALLNFGLGYAGGKLGIEGLTIDRLLSYPFRPLAWLIGVPWHEAGTAGGLLGLKTALNEFVAYQQMQNGFIANSDYLSPRSALLTAYALCGFANFASVGIQIGGISTMVPGRRAELSKIGLWAMAGGAVASLMGACVVGVLY